MTTTKATSKKLNHPLRFKSGKYKGKYPHEIEEAFISYLIVQGMTEDNYWAAMQSGEQFANELRKHGKPVKTKHLTPDQRGWAMLDQPIHAANPDAKWFVLDPEKPRKIIPAIWNIKRSRQYRENCDCKDPEYTLWGKRYDGEPLVQCEHCGEVVEAEWEEEQAA